MVSKKDDTSWIASEMHTGTGAMALGVEAVAVAVAGVGVNGRAVARAILGVSALSVVGLLGGEVELAGSAGHRRHRLGQYTRLCETVSVNNVHEWVTNKRTRGAADDRLRGARHPTRRVLLRCAFPE
jgi:hypothetical protein